MFTLHTVWNKISNWHTINYTEIVWFLIGTNTAFSFAHFANGNYIGAVITMAIAVFIYIVRK